MSKLWDVIKKNLRIVNLVSVLDDFIKENNIDLEKLNIDYDKLLDQVFSELDKYIETELDLKTIKFDHNSEGIKQLENFFIEEFKELFNIEDEVFDQLYYSDYINLDKFIDDMLYYEFVLIRVMKNKYNEFLLLIRIDYINHETYKTKLKEYIENTIETVLNIQFEVNIENKGGCIL